MNLLKNNKIKAIISMLILITIVCVFLNGKYLSYKFDKPKIVNINSFWKEFSNIKKVDMHEKISFYGTGLHYNLYPNDTISKFNMQIVLNNKMYNFSSNKNSIILSSKKGILINKSIDLSFDLNYIFSIFATQKVNSIIKDFPVFDYIRVDLHPESNFSSGLNYELIKKLQELETYSFKNNSVTTLDLNARHQKSLVFIIAPMRKIDEQTAKSLPNKKFLIVYLD